MRKQKKHKRAFETQNSKVGNKREKQGSKQNKSKQNKNKILSIVKGNV